MKFTKTYNVEINETQKNAMSRALKNTANYFVNTEKADVELLVNDFDGSRIIASLIVNGVIKESRIIGKKGGLTLV